MQRMLRVVAYGMMGLGLITLSACLADFGPEDEKNATVCPTDGAKVENTNDGRNPTDPSVVGGDPTLCDCAPSEPSMTGGLPTEDCGPIELGGLPTEDCGPIELGGLPTEDCGPIELGGLPTEDCVPSEAAMRGGSAR
jgi:hypothetical protein